MITVNARKYDGQIHRSWQAELKEENDDLYLFYGQFDQKIDHPDIGLILPGTGSFEYYWKNEWYNVFRFLEPDGELKCFYCNVNMPPELKGGVLDYIDLDLDILVKPDFTYRLLDEEEFGANVKKYQYSAEIVETCWKQIEQLEYMINARAFPFDNAL